MKILIFTDSRGQHKASFNNKKIFTEKLYEYFTKKNISCDIMLCPFKWTSTIDFIQCIEENNLNPDIYDYIILYTGVVEYSPRPLSNFIDAYYKNNDIISFNKLILNKSSRIANNKRNFFIKFFSKNDLNFKNYNIYYKGENTRSLISIDMHKKVVIPYLQKYNNKLIFINSNKIVKGWEGNYININPYGRPKNINIIHEYANINKDKFSNIVDLLSWNENDVKNYTIDNMHLTYEGSEYIFNKIIKMFENSLF
jgi:hypothetical protein